MHTFPVDFSQHAQNPFAQNTLSSKIHRRVTGGMRTEDVQQQEKVATPLAIASGPMDINLIRNQDPNIAMSVSNEAVESERLVEKAGAKTTHPSQEVVNKEAKGDAESNRANVSVHVGANAVSDAEVLSNSISLDDAPEIKNGDGNDDPEKVQMITKAFKLFPYQQQDF